ncbi:MAG: DUF4349 domain-containing protein [Acidimicrobiales bacterium]
MNGRRALSAAAVLVVGLVGATGLADALAAHGTTVTRSGSHATAVYAVAAPAAAALPRSLRASVAGGATGFSGGTGLAVNGEAQASAAPATPAVAQSALIEETGAISVVVRGADIQTDTTELMNVATAYGGFVASTQTQTASPGSPAQSTVTLQVPEASFDQVLNAVKGYGKVASLTTQATDVTGQYVDLQAQITALQDSRQQYLTIMTKATTIGGILSVQSQLDTLQSQLDQLQGQLRVLNSQTTYATLAVTVTQKVVAPAPPKPRSGLDKAWHGAVNGFVAGCEGVVKLAGPILFALLLGAALFVMGRTAWRLARRRASDAS